MGYTYDFAGNLVYDPSVPDARYEVDAQGNMVDVNNLMPGYSFDPTSRQVNYDSAWNSNPLTAVGYSTYDNAGNLQQVTTAQAREQSKTGFTARSAEEGWAAANSDPDFWNKYNAISIPHTATKSTSIWQDGTSSTVDTNDLLSGDGGFGGWMNQNLNAGRLSPQIEPINRNVGPLVLPTVMAIGGGLAGGGLAAAGLAGGALGGTAGAATTGAAMAGMGAAGTAAVGAGAGAGSALFGSLNQGIEQGDWGGAALNMGMGAVKGAVGGGLLGQFAGAGDVPVEMGNIPIGSSLAEMEALYPQVYGSMAYDAGLGGTVASTANQGLMYGTPEFYDAAGDLGMSAQQAGSLTDTSLGGQSAMGLTNTPITYGSPEMYEQGSDLGLSSKQAGSLKDASLGGQSADQLSRNSDPFKDMMKKQLEDALKKGLGGIGGNQANGQLPQFKLNLTPLSAQTFGTGNTWDSSNASGLMNKAAGFEAAPFKGSFLSSEDDKSGLTSYLQDYLPLSASKKIKDFSNFMA